MYRLLKISCLMFLLVCLLNTSEAFQSDDQDLFRALLDAPKVSSLNKAFAGMVLNRDIPEANVRLKAAWEEAMGDHTTLTPEVADEQFKWQMRTWVRIYYLFGPTGSHSQGRLSKVNAARIESLFWNYASAKSTVKRADLKYIWFIQGSENHDLMNLGNAFLAVKALAENPDYKRRALPDGHRPGEHAAAWSAYFTRYCEERFRNGLFVEFASPIYGKYLIPELVNIFDFATDPKLKTNVGALLDLVWADWALEQLNGVRGGAKARSYQGKYSRNGAIDCWYVMGNLLLGQGDWKNPNRYTHPIMGYGLILGTSGYRLPPVIAELATAPEQRGEYAYISRRPGRMTNVAPLPPANIHGCWYNMANHDSRLLRYTWCTPNHIMGSYWIDPSLREDFQIYPEEPERADGHYSAITTQNLWQGVIFDTNPDARIFPQCEAKPDKSKPRFSITYVQQVAVQHENVMLLQANRAHPDIKTMRVYFAPGMKNRLVERDGWRIIEEGNSYAAIRIFDRTDITGLGGATWDDELFLRTKDPFAPIVLVTGRKQHFATLDDFAQYLTTHTWSIEDGLFTYTFTDRSNSIVSMGLYTESARLPVKNGKPLNLAPSTYYQNPFFQESTDRRVLRINFLNSERAIALTK